MYRDCQVLITGGLGFLGSNLAIRLVEEGARVAIVDSSIEGCGANLYNIQPVLDRIELIDRDISEAHSFAERIFSSRIIFNLAGEISHLHSMKWPERDLEINTLSQLRFLDVCRRAARKIRIVYAGTRQVYGVPEYLPIDENHPAKPVDFNGVHKYAATMYHHMLSRSGEIDAVVLRFSNLYGPRMALNVPCQGFLSTFVRRMAFGDDIEVFGDGEQLRDPMFVDDAVEALMRAGANPVSHPTYNVGGPAALSLRAIAKAATEASGSGQVRFVPFPPERVAIDIGSYHTDSSLIAASLGFRPTVQIDEGLRRTLAYYRQNLSHYLNPSDRNPVCKLEHNTATAL